jgi:hypothetical protein
MNMSHPIQRRHQDPALLNIFITILFRSKVSILRRRPRPVASKTSNALMP